MEEVVAPEVASTIRLLTGPPPQSCIAQSDDAFGDPIATFLTPPILRQAYNEQMSQREKARKTMVQPSYTFNAPPVAPPSRVHSARRVVGNSTKVTRVVFEGAFGMNIKVIKTSAGSTVVVVSTVMPGSTGEKMGVSVGDTITGINDAPFLAHQINYATDFSKILKRFPKPVVINFNVLPIKN